MSSRPRARSSSAWCPTEFPAPTAARPVEIYATLQPARQIGGDLYDFFWSDARTLCFVIADVSDKGAAAALFMARTKTLIRLVATMLRTAAGGAPGPDTIIARVNEELCRDNPLGMFVTLFFGMLDVISGELHFVNAGHNVPYVVAPGRVVPLHGARAKPVGIRPTLTYAPTTAKLAPGECLFVFTDGITESMNEAGALLLRGTAGAGAGIPRGPSPARDRRGRPGRGPRVPGGGAPVGRHRGPGPPSGHMVTAETTIGNRRDELARVARIVDELAFRHHLAPDVVADVNVALDEVLTNIITYAYDDDRMHEIWIGFTIDERRHRGRGRGRWTPVRSHHDPPTGPERVSERPAGRWPRHALREASHERGGLLEGGRPQSPSPYAALAPMKKPATLVYGSEDRPPLGVTVLTGVQHAGVNAIFLLFPLLVSREGGLSAPQIGDVLSLAMLVMAAATIIQAYPVGPVGARLFCPMIYSAIYLGPSLAAVKAGGMSLVFGMTIFAGVVECALARILPSLRPIFPPEVAGLIILLIGLTNGTIGVRNLLGIGAAQTFTAADLAIGLASFAAMIALNVWTKGLCASSAA